MFLVSIHPLLIFVKSTKTMVVVIKKGTGKKRLNELLKKFKRSKKFNANRFLGKVQWNEDALAYQKRVRNEWD